MITSLGVLAALGLLIVSSFFSAAETALVALSPQKVKSLSLRKPELVHLLHGWLVRPHELQIVILVGNTFVNVMFATILTVLAVRNFPAVSATRMELYAWILGTTALVMFGEMAPKFYARANPERTTVWTLPWLSRIRRLADPLFRFVSFIAGKIYSPLRTAPVPMLMTLSLEEVRSLLEEDQHNQDRTDETLTMMQRVIEINDRRAENIMVPWEKVDFIEIDPVGRPPRSRDQLIDRIIEEGHTRTPVKIGGEIAGFIHSDDLLPLVLRDPGRGLSQMVRRALEVPADRKVGDLLQDFRRSGVYMGFVRNAAGNVIGLVTLEDVLEEITGEILDEYDVSHPASPTDS